MTRLPLAIATVAVLASSQLFAVDIITRKSDGKKVSGAISDMSKTEITLKKPVGEPDVVQANDVGTIEWDGAVPICDWVIPMKITESTKTALNRYQKAKNDAKSPSDNLKTEFDYIIARVNAQIAMGDPSKQASAVQGLQAIQKSRPEHFRFYDSVSTLGRLQLAMGDFAGARTTFDQLNKAPWSDYKLAAKIAMGRILVAEGKPDEAVKEFEAAAAAATDSPADQARKYDAMLGQARTLIAQKKFEESLNILELVTDKGPAEESDLQAEAYVLEGNSLQALGRMKEAVLAYLHVDILYAREAAFHAEALYHLSKAWKQIQLPDRGTEAEAKLIQNYPNSPWRKKLAE